MRSKYSAKYILNTGSGLQDVDKIENSPFFNEEAQKYFKGEISLDELEKKVNTYYRGKAKDKNRFWEADKVAIRIAKLISDDSFSFTEGQLLTIHKSLFKGIVKNSGKLRSFNFSKHEWVLDGESVTYGDYKTIKDTLQSIINSEKEFSYKGLSIDEIINHLSIFISDLWQVHAFEEGNTRTVAVFVIKYLRFLGFKTVNDTFAKNAWYFRNALVRANYNNLKANVTTDRSFLIKFLRNLMLNENIELRNRTLHIYYTDSSDNAFMSIKETVHKMTTACKRLLNTIIICFKNCTNWIVLQVRKIIYMIKNK